MIMKIIFINDVCIEIDKIENIDACILKEARF